MKTYKVIKSQDAAAFTRMIENEVNHGEGRVMDIDYKPMIMKGGSVLYTAFLTIHEATGRPMASA